MRDLCFGCKSFKDVVTTEADTGQPFCADCAATLPPAPEQVALAFLALTIPFQPGDRVRASTAGGTEYAIFDGVGEVTDVYMDLEHGGTPVFPTFRVVIDEKAYPEAPDEALYTEVCLEKVGSK